MKIKSCELAELMDYARANGSAIEQARAEVRKFACEASELREELRAVKFERDQAKCKAATLDAMLKESHDKVDRLERYCERLERRRGGKGRK